MTRYDVIVLGTGGVGSAAAYHLARRGHSVLCLDRFPPGHDRGSSHGQTRIIRKAYFEHADYVPLLHRAYQLWDELQDASRQQLYFPSGLIEIGPPDGVVLPGVRESARRFGLPIDDVSADDLQKLYPGFSLPDGCEAVFERDAGFLLVERCVEAHANAAAQAGATLQAGVEVVGWSASEQRVEVVSANDAWQAARLVIAAGGGARNLLAELGIRLRIIRKHLHWYGNEKAEYHVDQGCPAFFYELDQDYYYGFPQIDERGVKVAEHSRGIEVTTVVDDQRSIEPDEKERVETFLDRCLPRLGKRHVDHTVCHYTMSPDEHFIVDRHPVHRNVTIAAGLSGHGFKFTSVLGEILADLAVDGTTSHPIDFLGCGRFS